jgi:hypothetical protein
MATSGKATLHGLCSLQEDATLEAFLSALEAYLRHLQAAGYVFQWHVEPRKVLGHFDTAVSRIVRLLSRSHAPISHTTTRAISMSADGRNRSMPCTWPCTSRYKPVPVFASPTNRPRRQQ